MEFTIHSKIGLMAGICVPNTCSPQIIKKFVETLIAQLPLDAIEYNVLDDSCQGNDHVPYTSGEIRTM